MGFSGVVVDFFLSHPYVHAIGIFIFAILIAEFLLYFFKHVVERIARKTKSRLDNQIIFRVEHPVVLIVILVGILLALKKILTSAYFFENLILTLIIFVVTYMLSGISSILINYWQKIRAQNEEMSNDEFHDEVLPLMKSLIKIVFAIVSIIVVLQLWGVQVGALLASVGIVGIILGFAFQDTLKNIFGGIALISDNAIRKHDVVRLESGEIGEVIEMSLRSTKLKTFDNDYLMVPNGLLANSRFLNFAQPTPTMRISVPVGVAYGSDADKVKDVLLDVLKGRNDVLNLPRREVRFIKMNDFSIDFELLFYIHNYKERFLIADSVTTDIYKALAKNNIQIPFPTRTIYDAGKLHKKSVSKKKTSPKKSAKKSKKTKKSVSTKKAN